jgi:hypothetical protein
MVNPMSSYGKRVSDLGGLVNLTLMVLIIVFFARYYHLATPTPTPCETVNVTVNSTCDDGRILEVTCNDPQNACRLGYIIPDIDACVLEDAPTGTACSSPCYVPDAATTACDNITGGCTGDVTECRGYCDAETDLNATIPFNDFWIGVNESASDMPIFWNYGHVCYWNRAILFVLQLWWSSNTGNTGEPVGAYSRCEDYLALDFDTTVAAGCLDITLELLSANLTNPVHYLNDTEAVPQFALCIYKYKCAALNQTAIEDGKKRMLPDHGEALLSNDYLHQIGRELLAKRPFS